MAALPALAVVAHRAHVAVHAAVERALALAALALELRRVVDVRDRLVVVLERRDEPQARRVDQERAARIDE